MTTPSTVIGPRMGHDFAASTARAEGRSAQRIRALGRCYVRTALGITFLAAVADRFGWWGANGRTNVAWGDFGHFVHYTRMVNSFLPASLAPILAWAATAAEITLGLALLSGVCRRFAALGSGVLLLLFALAMAASFGIKSPLNYSVFSASAAAFLLFVSENEESRT